MRSQYAYKYDNWTISSKEVCHSIRIMQTAGLLHARAKLYLWMLFLN